MNKAIYQQFIVLVATATLIFFSSSLLSRSNASDLPKLGDTAGATLSVMQEQQIGDQIMTQIRRSRYLVQDPLVNDYIQQVGYKLVAANPDAMGRSFRFFVIQEPSINAFALPGGYIGIHSGLITASKTESELASVLGHEVAHVTQRHLARRLERQNELSLPTILATIGAILVATQDPEAGVGALAATQGLSAQSIINHTRANEKEADRIGIAMLSKAGFDTRGAANFFETLEQQSRFTRKPPEILLTHPLSKHRITDARTRAASYPTVEHESSLDYLLVKARIKSQEKSRDTKFLQHLKTKPNKSFYERYLLAELLRANAEIKKAITIYQQLYQEKPDNQVLLYSLAEAHQANNSSEKALPLLLKQMKQYPGSTKLILATANAYLATANPQKAEKLLLRYSNTHQSNANYLFTLAKSQQALNHVPEMHETTGQYMILVGDYRTAKKHFEMALGSTSNDPYAQIRIQARLNTARQKIREQLEKKK